MNRFSVGYKSSNRFLEPKLMVACSVLFFVVGCQNSTLRYDINEQQKIYINETTKNYGGLIDLYKQRLKRADTEDTRHSLAKVYYLTNDYQAVKRVLDPIIKKTKNDGILILYGHVESRLGHNDTALEYLNKAIEINNKNGEAYNVRGIVQLKKSQYDAARYSFHEARENFYDENKVTNNLAMLSILTKEYSEAYKQLNILYTKGYRDQTILHNLLYTLVKLDKIQLARSFCVVHKLSSEPDVLIQELKQIEPNDAIKFNEVKPSQSDNQKQYTIEKESEQLISNTKNEEVIIKSKDTKSTLLSSAGTNIKLSNMTRLDTSDQSETVDEKSNMPASSANRNRKINPILTQQSDVLAVRSGEHEKFTRVTFETSNKLNKNNYSIENISPTEFKLSFYDVTLPAKGVNYVVNRISNSGRDFENVKGMLTDEKTLILQIKTKQRTIVKDFYAGCNTKGTTYCFAFDFYLEKK